MKNFPVHIPTLEVLPDGSLLEDGKTRYGSRREFLEATAEADAERLGVYLHNALEAMNRPEFAETDGAVVGVHLVKNSRAEVTVDCATERHDHRSALLGSDVYRRVFNVSRLEAVRDGTDLVAVPVSSHLDIHAVLRGAVAALMQPLIEHAIDYADQKAA